MQRDAEGSVVKTKSWWEGDFHKTLMEGGKRGSLESWRHVDCGLMIVRTTLTPSNGRSVSVIWYLEEMSVPGKTTFHFQIQEILSYIDPVLQGLVYS